MSQEKDNTLRRSLTMINGVTPTKSALTATKESPTTVSRGASMLTTDEEGSTLTPQPPHEDDANAVKYNFNVWNTLAMWSGELYADTRSSFYPFVRPASTVISYAKFEQLLVAVPCLKEKTGTVKFWNELAKKEGKPYLEEKWIDNYSVQLSPYDQMLEACNEYDQRNSFEIDGKAVEDWGNIFEAREDKTITRLVFDKFIGLCDTIELDKYGDLKTLSSCADCGIGTNGSQYCGKTHCYHLNFRYRPNENCEWRYERHNRSGKDANFLPEIPTGFMCDVEIGGVWYRVHHPKRKSPADLKRSEKFVFKEIRCKVMLGDDSPWKYFIVESTSLKSFIESEKMVAVERYSVSKYKWVSCLKEIIDLTDDDDAQDQKLTKLPAPPSPSKVQKKPVTKTPSKTKSKKRKAFETPERELDNVVQCPGAPQRKKTKVRASTLQRMGTHIRLLQQKNKALEERVAQLMELLRLSLAKRE